MPGADELDWKELSDFTAGYFNRGDDRECPPNGLLELTDAFPLPTGGLRAFGKFQQASQTGLPANGTDAVVLGVWEITGSGTGFNPYGTYCMTLQFNTGGAGVHTFRLHHLSGNAGSGDVVAGTWTEIFKRTDVTACDTTLKLVDFRTTALGSRGYFNFSVDISAGTTEGIWRTDGTTAVYCTSAANPNMVFSHQARLMTVVNETDWMRIDYTEPGVDTFPATTVNQLRPVGEHGGRIQFAVPIVPSDLFIYKREWGVVNIQGDITAPLVRQMNFLHNDEASYACQSDLGLVWVVTREGAFVYDGGSVETLSPNIKGDAMNGADLTTNAGTSFLRSAAPSHLLLNPAAGSNWIFFGNGYVMDTRTRAWFKVSGMTGTPRYWSCGPLTRQAIVSTSRNFVSGNPIYYCPFTEQEWTPVSSYVFTTPLVYNANDQTVIRELEYHLATFTASSTIAVEVIYRDNNGTVQTTGSGGIPAIATVTLGAATNQKVRIQVGTAPSDWLKVRTTLAAPGGFEAPMLERMLIGSQASHPYSTDG